jgi:hypothetical protein
MYAAMAKDLFDRGLVGIEVLGRAPTTIEIERAARR